MTAKLHSTRRRLWKYGATTATLITGLALVLIFALSAAANQQSTSAALAACATSSHLPNSKFEVDAIVPPPAGSKKNAVPTGGANLKVDGATGDCIDWLNDAGNGMRAGVIVQPDKQTGSGDDSFGQGTAENDQVPTVVSGSIPPNKSDLSNFGIYQEKEGAQSFLSVFWSRVQNPSGTTNMDFEFNKNKCDSNDPSHSNCSSNGVTPVRSDGDKLLLYDLDSGGSTVSISIRTWNGTTNQWSDADPLNGTEALGSANYDAIPSGESGGLGALSSLTFGEATVDLNVLLGANCGKFGSVYLKSRSSTSFTSEIKDFIAPKVVTISNCSAIATSATNSTMPNAITDTATLTDVTNPTGSITFKVYTDAACTTLAPGTSTITVNSPFTANGSGGYTAQASYTPTAAGTFYWIASYSGDGNNNAVSGSCGDTGETSTVSKANSSMATYENLVPNDTASITPNTATGSVEFYLFKPGQTCSVANEVNAVLHQTRPLSSGSATTNNTSDTDTLAGGTHANAIGTWKWIASYAGDGNLNGSDSICTETFSISN
jgi:hypothetical protein